MPEPLPDVNHVLDKILKLTQSAVTDFQAAERDSPDWHLCRGKLLALHQVIGLFSTVEIKKLAATN